MSENNFTNTVESLFKGMDAFITTKTVVGDAVRFDDGTIVLPLVDVSFGVAGCYRPLLSGNSGWRPAVSVRHHAHRSCYRRTGRAADRRTGRAGDEEHRRCAAGCRLHL